MQFYYQLYLLIRDRQNKVSKTVEKNCIIFQLLVYLQSKYNAMKFLFFLSLFFVFASFNACEKVTANKMAFTPEYIEEGNYIAPNGDTITIERVERQNDRLRVTKSGEGDIPENQIEIVYDNIGTSHDCIFYCTKYGADMQMAKYGGFITLNKEGFVFDCSEEILVGFLLSKQQHNQFERL